jgi:hypothetical protein
MIVRAMTLLLMAVVLLTACGGGSVAKEPSAAALMPNLPGYVVTNTLDIQDAIAKLAGATSLGAAHPELSALVAGVHSLTACYQQAGALEGRAYVNQSDVSKAGVIVIVNRNVVTDPNTFLNCVAPSAGFAPRTAQVEPCAKTFTLNKDNNQYFVGYAATAPEVCQAFCAALQGCTP